MTASFTKELIRRCVVNAALAGRAPEDADVSHALDEMLSDAEALTRTLLGGEGGYFPEPDDSTAACPDASDRSRVSPRAAPAGRSLRGMRVENSTNGEISPSDRRTEGKKSPLVEFSPGVSAGPR